MKASVQFLLATIVAILLVGVSSSIGTSALTIAFIFVACLLAFGGLLAYMDGK